MYKISEEKYDEFVETIKMAEDNLSKHDAITLDMRTGEFKLSMEASTRCPHCLYKG